MPEDSIFPIGEEGSTPELPLLHVPEAPEGVLHPNLLKELYKEVQSLQFAYGTLGKVRTRASLLPGFTLRTAPNYLRHQFHALLRKHLPPSIFARESFSFENLEALGIDMTSFNPLVDLGSFDLQQLRAGKLDAKKLADAGMKTVTIMEDRAPMFYLNHQEFNESEPVPLNRHGNTEDVWTHTDLEHLIDMLHLAGIRVNIGFWGNMKDHEQNPFVHKNWGAVMPVIPSSDDLNPLSFVRDEQERSIPFADYIVNQFVKLRRDFGVDGLFLGDGLMGFRSFLDPNGPYDSSNVAPLWTDFYKRISLGIKKADPQAELWAYDCMGNGTNEARKNGVDLAAIEPHIDRYVFQSYGNDAWGGRYMKLPGHDLQRDKDQLTSLPDALKKKTLYTIGLGDKIEGWHGNSKNIKAKNEALKDDAKAGTLGVWSTHTIRELLK